jgi:DNA-binding transcriptional LysR family regulator
MRRGLPVTLLVQEDGQTQRITPAPTHQLSDGEAIIAAAVAGFGICQMPSQVLSEHLRAGTLVPILENHSQGTVGVQVVWTRQGQLCPKVRYVVDRLLEFADAAR